MINHSPKLWKISLCWFILFVDPQFNDLWPLFIFQVLSNGCSLKLPERYDKFLQVSSSVMEKSLSTTPSRREWGATP
jgi:hypothetical protein